MTAHLSALEEQALDLTARLARTMREIIGTEGDCVEGDTAEMERIIHDLQCRILAQLGSRGDAIYCRPLGGWVRDIPAKNFRPDVTPPAS